MTARHQAFTLVELLVVLSIMAIAAGIALGIPTADKRRTAVEASAKELAAYLRQAHGMALRNRAGYAVVFNVANGAGTSGAVVNNWDGEHWYRLLGPGEFDYSRGNHGTSFHPRPTGFFAYTAQDNFSNVPAMARRVRTAWVGEAQRLPAKKVRFLALTDLDNGHSHKRGNGNTLMSTFPATYPRPWCGWFDTTTKTLRAWGGYDPALTHDARSNSAFYFQGDDPPIVGCRNPADRISGADYTEYGNVSNGGNGVLTKDKVRPLVNGEWMDYFISFRPDGTVKAGRFGELRAESVGQGTNAVFGNTPYGDIGDLGPRENRYGENFGHSYELSDEVFTATSTQARTGYWYVTIAPDISTDTAVFSDAQAAVRSMMPAIRVGVNAFGDVRVVPVQQGLARPLSTAITGGDWQNRTVTEQFFRNSLVTDATGNVLGDPIVDALSPEMLAQRVWWYAP